MSRIALALIDPDPNNPRTSQDDAALTELAASMRENGLLQPILVTPTMAPLYVCRYKVVVGHRRLAAAALLGWETIPAQIAAPKAEAETRLVQLVENLQREDLSPIDLARGLNQALQGGMTQADLARRLGKSQPWVSNTIRLLGLPEEVQALLASGALTARHGRALLQWADRPEECVAHARIAADPTSCLNVGRLERLAQGERERERERSLPRLSPPASEPWEAADEERELAGAKGGEVLKAPVWRPEPVSVDGDRRLAPEEPLITEELRAEWEAAAAARPLPSPLPSREEQRVASELLSCAVDARTKVTAIVEDDRGLALIAHQVLGSVEWNILRPLVEARGLVSVADAFDWDKTPTLESVWASLATVDPIELLTLCRDALLQRDLYWARSGTAPARALWYVGGEVEP